MKKIIDKYYKVIVAFLFILILATRFYGLKHPEWKVFDEIYYTDFAQKHLSGGEYFDVHPPMGKLFISQGIRFFGDNPLGWRVSEAFIGVFCVILIYSISQKLFKNKYISLISLFLSLCSTMLLVESRLALINIFIVFFILSTVYLFFLWKETKNNYILFLSGICFSYALLVKWSALYIFFPLLAYLLIDPETRKLFYQEFIIKWYNLAILLMLSVTTYFVIFQLTDISQFSLFDWHAQAFGFHKNLTQTHPYASKWYTWLLMIRPICIEYKDLDNGGKIVGILQIGNLAIFWTSIVAIIYAIFRFFKNEKNKNILFFIVISIFSFLLPWVFISRISFLYLFLPAVPFLIILVSWFVYNLLRTKYNIIGFIILLLAFSWFVYFFPIVVGMPVTKEQYQQRMWLKTWI